MASLLHCFLYLTVAYFLPAVCLSICSRRTLWSRVCAYGWRINVWVGGLGHSWRLQQMFTLKVDRLWPIGAVGCGYCRASQYTDWLISTCGRGWRNLSADHRDHRRESYVTIVSDTRYCIFMSHTHPIIRHLDKWYQTSATSADCWWSN